MDSHFKENILLIISIVLLSLVACIYLMTFGKIANIFQGHLILPFLILAPITILSILCSIFVAIKATKAKRIVAIVVIVLNIAIAGYYLIVILGTILILSFLALFRPEEANWLLDVLDLVKEIF